MDDMNLADTPITDKVQDTKVLNHIYRVYNR